MNLNPKSPFSGKPLPDCDNHERDAWAAKLCGWTELHQIMVGRVLMKESWVGTDPENGSCWFPPPFTTTWAAAGPLMEREEWLRHTPEIEFFGPKDAYNKINIFLWWDGKKSLAACQDNEFPLAVTLAFIIAAEHAKGNRDA